MTLTTIDTAIAAIKQGKMLILTDDEHRENEGDLIMAAESITPEAINFMATHGRGLICLALHESMVQQLQLPMMVQNNQSAFQTPFTVSIEAAEGVTTGISAFDRARTVQAAVACDASSADWVSPGHIFPLRAHPQGVLGRDGQTEGSVDLAQLAGLRPAAVICEIMNADGTMARMPDLEVFAKQHDIAIVSIKQLQQYRMQHENVVRQVAEAQLPIDPWGQFTMYVFEDTLSGKEHVVLYKQPVDATKPILSRVHSACFTGDIFSSKRCDCGEQLQYALKKISEEGGVLLYLPQEGRGIGLANKIKAYALQEQGMDTVEANHHLGFKDDLRDYAIAAQIFRALGIKKTRLLTNNPDKLTQLREMGLEVTREPITIKASDDNMHYLRAKKEKLGHLVMEQKEAL